MEDVWFATNSKTYTFNVEDVKIRRKVIAPYKADGESKDWEETEEGNFRNTYPSTLLFPSGLCLKTWPVYLLN